MTVRLRLSVVFVLMNELFTRAYLPTFNTGVHPSSALSEENEKMKEVIFSKFVIEKTIDLISYSVVGVIYPSEMLAGCAGIEPEAVSVECRNGEASRSK